MSGKSYFDENVPIIVLKSLFEKYDENNNGMLCKHELSTLLEDDLGLSWQQAEAYNLLLDKDASGKISFAEFKDWITSGEKFKNINDNSRYQVMISAVEMFNRYDMDRNKGLDWSEFTQLHVDCGGHPEHVTSALDVLDKDKNGVISFYEFLKWLKWVDIGHM